MSPVSARRNGRIHRYYVSQGHCHGKMVEAAVRRSRPGRLGRSRMLPLLCRVGPEQTHGAAGEEVTLE